MIGTQRERFWARVKKTDSCWIWQGPTQKFGYGTAHKGKKFVLAHRFSWEEHYGPIPGKLFVCHHCDNPPCVNPAHLFLGNAADNAQDASRKGRFSKKGRNKKLSELDVLSIRATRTGISNTLLGRIYGVSNVMISQIRRNVARKYG